MPRPRRWTDQQLTHAVAASTTLSEVCRRIGIRPRSYDVLRVHIARVGVDAEHLMNPTPRRRWTDDELRTAVADATAVTDVQRALGYRVTGGTHGLITRHIQRLGLDTSHFLGRARTRGRTTRTRQNASRTGSSSRTTCVDTAPISPGTESVLEPRHDHGAGSRA